MSKFLVTGGAGFIGSHIVERLVKDGHVVRVLDNLSSGKKENISGVLKEVEFINGDIRDFEAVKKATEGMDFVLHHAALRSVPGSLKNPDEYNEVNIAGTLNLLKASVNNNIKRFVFASSSAIYGDTDKSPQRESDLPRLISPYALSKLAGEYYCRIFSHSYGLETVSLRYFNVFGPKQAPDDEYAGVVPKFIICMLNNQAPPIYGTGKQSRDFVYIDNIVEANILAATQKGLKCEVINIGCGRADTILELVKVLNSLMDKSLKPVFDKPRPGDVLRTLSDISLAKKVLGHKTKIDLKEGLRRTISWFQK
ncbi:MAG: SDR family oxidoreductase [Candidatus Omnitrophica bacterium]|nr:SDR family oxidoreductase [Candidatus Omnitrophota bacterium]